MPRLLNKGKNPPGTPSAIWKAMTLWAAGLWKWTQRVSANGLWEQQVSANGLSRFLQMDSVSSRFMQMDSLSSRFMQMDSASTNGLCEQQVSANGLSEQQVYANGLCEHQWTLWAAGFCKWTLWAAGLCKWTTLWAPMDSEHRVYANGLCEQEVYANGLCFRGLALKLRIYQNVWTYKKVWIKKSFPWKAWKRSQFFHYFDFFVRVGKISCRKLVLWMRIRMDPHWFWSAGSGSRSAKMTNKNIKKERNFMFWSADRSLLRVEF